MNVCCGRQYQPSPTFSIHGRFSCRVRTQGPVTQSGPCRRQCLSTTHEAMTSGSGPQRRTSFPKFRGPQPSRTVRNSWQPSQCAWVVSG